MDGTEILKGRRIMKFKIKILSFVMLLMVLMMTETAFAATPMLKQGNLTSFNLNTIAETNKAEIYIKISTQFDPDLSMYDYSSMPEGTKAIAVTYDISGFDQGSAPMYWCYQLQGGDYTAKSLSCWDASSPTDKITVDADGRYMLVFNAKAALNGDLTLIESLQMVFACGSVDAAASTATKFKCIGVECITDEAELANYVSGKVEIPVATVTPTMAPTAVPTIAPTLAPTTAPVEATTVPAVEAESAKADTDSSSLYIIIVVAVVLIAAVITGLVVAKKKKNIK